MVNGELSAEIAKHVKLSFSLGRERLAIQCFCDNHINREGLRNDDFRPKWQIACSDVVKDAGTNTVTFKSEGVKSDWRAIYQCHLSIDVVVQVGFCSRHKNLPEECIVFLALQHCGGIWSVNKSSCFALPLEDISAVLNCPKAGFVTGYIEAFHIC